jgi:hypothetical protein
VCENRVLRRIFGPKREEVAGGWRSLYNEELHNLYTSPNIIRLIKSRRMRWTVEEVRYAYKILVEILKWIDNLEELRIDARLILQWILEKQGGKLQIGFMWLRTWTIGTLL